MAQFTCHCGATVAAANDFMLAIAKAGHDLLAHGVMPAVDTIAKVAVSFGKPEENTMNGSMTLTQKEPFFIDGFNADGTVGVLAPGQTVLVTIDDAAVASISTDAVPGTDSAGVQSITSGVATALKVGSTNLNATIVNADTSKGPTVSAIVTVTAVTAAGITTLTAVFGTPVTQ